MGCSTSLFNDDGMRTLKDFSSSGLCDSPDGFLKTSIILSSKSEVKVKFYFSLFIICMGVTFSDYYLSVSTHPSASEQLYSCRKEGPLNSADGLYHIFSSFFLT